MLCPEELRERYADGRVIPFIGAGVSMSVEWEVGGIPKRGPSWGELVEQATSILGFADADLARVRGTDLQILEYFKLKHAGETARLTNWVAREMNPPDDALQRSIIHAELAALDLCRLFYTTNFDNFIERALQLRSRPCNVVAVEAQMGSSTGECEVIKFHGDLDNPTQIVLTESDYEERLRLATALDFRLRADLLGRVTLFIGYSFRDPNVSYLFRLFTKQFWEQAGALPGGRAYIIVPDPSDFELELFEARRIRVIPVSRTHITEQTAQVIKEMRD